MISPLTPVQVLDSHNNLLSLYVDLINKDIVRCLGKYLPKTNIHISIAVNWAIGIKADELSSADANALAKLYTEAGWTAKCKFEPGSGYRMELRANPDRPKAG